MPDGQTLNAMLSAYGVSAPDGGFNWANLIGGVIFGTIGFSAFMYGKKERSVKPLGIGIALMAYPYFVPNTIAVYAIGIILTAALVFWKD